MPFNLFLLLALLLEGLFFAQAVQASDALDPQWIRLLHYRKDLFGKYISDADGKEFFLHPEGKYSPEKELGALIAKKDLPEIQCRFPARLRFLEKKDVSFHCPELMAFRKRMSASSLSVVFSSYYLNNPSSSFGHTFIRLGKGDKVTELLDTGINYGAFTGNAGPLWHALGGLSGFFPGTFNAIPYYYKVREYNDYETRDLWSYEIDLSQEQIDLLVDHIWELGHTHFDYYFLKENCSYHVLSLLELAFPQVHLLEKMPYLYTIPSDTLKVLVSEKLVKRISFRPAPSTVFYSQLRSLTPQEKKLVLPLIEGHQERASSLPPIRQALLYDTAISLVDYKHAKDILEEKESALKIKRPLLLARSKIPVRSQDLSFEKEEKWPPHVGHGSKRLALSVLKSSGQDLMDLQWRFAFHDLLDYDVAYPRHSRVEIGKVNVRTDGHDFQLREVALLDLLSLGHWDAFNGSPSWKVRLGQWQTRRAHQDLSTQGLQLGYGYSSSFKALTPYILAHGETSYVSEKLRQLKLDTGLDGGVLFDFNQHLKWNTAYEWRAFHQNETCFKNELRYSDKVLGFGAYHQVYVGNGNGDGEWGLKFFAYY